LLDYFSSVVIEHVPRNHNQEANRLTQSASGYWQVPEMLNNHLIDGVEDWRVEFVKYLKDSS
jgi:hypothetical protein